MSVPPDAAQTRAPDAAQTRAPDAAQTRAPDAPLLGPVVLRLAQVEPDRDAIYRLVGVSPQRPVHRRWIDLVETLLADLRRLMRPRAVYRIDRVDALAPRRVVLTSGVTFEGAIGQFLKHSTMMATYVATIGSAVERLSRAWLKAGKVMQGAIADAIASESAEAVAQAVQDAVRAWARARGCDVTPRYSPGYCGMTVRQQIPLFAMVPAERINVRITPSCLMLPVKSTSGLIGIGPADKVAPGGYPCEACIHPDCMQRRAPTNPAFARCACEPAES